ncbi:MAG: glycerol-3-phosphate acyltransferase [Pseudoflavonifractor sp.]
MLVLIYAAVAVLAYFLGCFNGAVIVSKYILKNDIRTHGSGNGGLTNFYRVFGGPLTLAVILCDMLKAVVAVILGVNLLGLVYLDPLLAAYYAALFCMLGHMYPCMFGFHGGKGILTGGAAAIMISIYSGNPWLSIAVWGGFLVLVLLTRWVSLGSIYAGIAFPIATWFCYKNFWCAMLALVCGGLIVWKHRANMARLLKGQESKFTIHRKEQ